LRIYTDKTKLRVLCGFSVGSVVFFQSKFLPQSKQRFRGENRENLCSLCGFSAGSVVFPHQNFYRRENRGFAEKTEEISAPSVASLLSLWFFPIIIFTAEQAEVSRRKQRKSLLPLWLLCWLCGFFEGTRTSADLADLHG
jgi:hypothetical protein